MPEPAAETYVGDGVYAHCDGANVWLRTQEGNEIAINCDNWDNVYRICKQYLGPPEERP
jgi:hypothetical protein